MLLSTNLFYGFLILIITPLLFHLITFRGDRNFLHILSSILIAEYVLTVFSMSLGLVNYFRAGFILAFTWTFLIFLGILIRKKRIIKLDAHKVATPEIFLTLLFAFYLLIVQRHLFLPNDTLKVYLPWGRIIAQTSSIPAYHLENNYHIAIYKPPILYTKIAALFSLQGGYELDIIKIIPIFFSSLTVFLLLNWSKELNKKSLWLILIPLFGVWPLFTQYSIFVLEEVLILFYSTASFYLLFKYWDTRNKTILAFIGLSSTLGALSKFSGVVILFMILVVLLIRSRDKDEILKIIPIVFLFYIPAIAWYYRNWYFYGNPFLVRFADLFGRGYGGSIFLSKTLYPLKNFMFTRWRLPFIKQFLKDLVAGFPFFLLSVFYIIDHRKKFKIKFVIFSAIALFIVIFFSGEIRYTRYMMPMYGIFALYSGLKVYSILERKSNLMMNKNFKIISLFFILFLMIFSFVRINNYYSQHDPYKGEKEIIDYIINNDPSREGVRIFGNWDPTLQWYAYVTFIPPNGKHYLILNEGKRFEFGKDTAYYYELFKRVGIDYVFYDPGKIRDVEYREVFQKIDADERNFELVITKDRKKLWKLK